MRRGQSLIDFVFILLIVTMAATAMFQYMRRGIQAAVKKTADQLGTQVATSADPTVTKAEHSLMYTEGEGEEVVTTAEGGSRTKTFTDSGHSYGEGVSVSEQEI